MTYTRHNRLFWGILLISMGGLFMLSPLDLLKINIWNLIFPGFLIFCGIWILFGMFTQPRTYHRERKTFKARLENTKQAQVRVHHSATRLEVSGGAPANQLIIGKFGPDVDPDVKYKNDTLYVDLRSSHDMWPRMFSPWSWSRRGFPAPGRMCSATRNGAGVDHVHRGRKCFPPGVGVIPEIGI